VGLTGGYELFPFEKNIKTNLKVFYTRKDFNEYFKKL
jgi:hypothetical protein